MSLGCKPAGWSSGNVFVSEAEGLRFISRAGRIGQTVLPTARHRCVISSKGTVLPASAMSRRWAPQTCFSRLRRITASILLIKNERFDLNLNCIARANFTLYLTRVRRCLVA